MAVLSDDGKPAVTRARVLERFGTAAAALVECRLETGRTHQIRVHMAFAGHPLVGDAVYGRRRAAGHWSAASRARRCTRRASASCTRSAGAALRFESPLPADMQALLDGLAPESRRTSDV